MGGRFLEDRTEARSECASNSSPAPRLVCRIGCSTLNNNSEFTNPNPQTTSELVLSVTQPLLAGGGYHYNTARLKVAKLDSKMAAAEYIRQLESYLLEVNRAYWGVYLARAGYLQKRSLVDRTEGIVTQLQEREGVDESANLSELLRARSSLAQRRASLIRSAMAIRTAEERLRALVNDPRVRPRFEQRIHSIHCPYSGRSERKMFARWRSMRLPIGRKCCRVSTRSRLPV